MCARPDLWEAWVSNHPGPPGPMQVNGISPGTAACATEPIWTAQERLARPLSVNLAGQLLGFVVGAEYPIGGGLRNSPRSILPRRIRAGSGRLSRLLSDILLISGHPRLPTHLRHRRRSAGGSGGHKAQTLAATRRPATVAAPSTRRPSLPACGGRLRGGASRSRRSPGCPTGAGNLRP